MEQKLPLRASLYITSVVILGVAALVDVCLHQSVGRTFFYGLPFLVALGYLAGRNSINITSNRSMNGTASISVGFFAVLVNLLQFGMLPGVVVALASILPLINKKLEPYQLVFNGAAVVVIAWFIRRVIDIGESVGLTVTLFTDKSGATLPLMLGTIAFTLVVALLYHLTNALLITGAISFSLSWPLERAKEFYRQNTLWTAPIYALAGGAVVLVVWVIQNLLHEPAHYVPLCLLIVPLPILFFHNLRLHRERDQEREQRFKELESLYTSMVTAMGRAIEAKDRYTQEHIERVVSISMGIGRQMCLTPSALRSLEVGAALHDIGKIAIPEEILNKPAKLTPEEFLLVQEHAALGSEILQPVPFPPEVVHAVRHHHEKWDGTGYPDRLAGDKIPLVARIVAVADVYDALTSDRPYREAWSHERALAFLRDQVGKHFDSEVFVAFERAMALEPHLQSKLHDTSTVMIEPTPLRLAA